MLIPCASPNSTSLSSFVCVCTLVSEIHEFNQRTSQERAISSLILFEMVPIFWLDLIFDGMETMMHDDGNRSSKLNAIIMYTLNAGSLLPSLYTQYYRTG